jgi:glutamate racemase
LAKLVEAGNREEISEYLTELIGPYRGKVGAVVLGCTHYVFCKEMIEEMMRVPVIHGNIGTVERLRDVLAERNLLNDGEKIGETVLLSSAGDEKARYYQRFL